MDGGRISKLEVRRDGEIVMDYDRGWDQKPRSWKEKAILKDRDKLSLSRRSLGGISISIWPWILGAGREDRCKRRHERSAVRCSWGFRSGRRTGGACLLIFSGTSGILPPASFSLVIARLPASAAAGQRSVRFRSPSLPVSAVCLIAGSSGISGRRPASRCSG
jgi:hypothetical protein